MKLQITFDESAQPGMEQNKTVTIEGYQPAEIEGIIRGYIRPMLLCMEFHQDTVDEYLGEE